MKGQVSFTWALVAVFLGLLMTTWLWIIVDETENKVYEEGIRIGVDKGKMNTMNALWQILPFALLVSFIIFIWVMGAATPRGGL